MTTIETNLLGRRVKWTQGGGPYNPGDEITGTIATLYIKPGDRSKEDEYWVTVIDDADGRLREIETQYCKVIPSNVCKCTQTP